MTTVTRADFIAAIEAGIKAANLSDVNAEALRKVGAEAKIIGTNYHGCPVIRAKMVERKYGERMGRGIPSVEHFVRVYDDAMILANREYAYGPKVRIV